MTKIVYKLNNLYNTIKYVGIKYSLTNDIIDLIFNNNEYEFDIDIKDFKYVILTSKNMIYGHRDYCDRSDYRSVIVDNFTFYLDMKPFYEKNKPIKPENVLMTLLPKSKLESLHITYYHWEWDDIYNKFHGIPPTLKKFHVPHFFSMNFTKYKNILNTLEELIDDSSNKYLNHEDWYSSSLEDIQLYDGYNHHSGKNSYHNTHYIIADNRVRVIRYNYNKYTTEGNFIEDDDDIEYYFSDNENENDKIKEYYCGHCKTYVDDINIHNYCNICKECFNNDLHKYHNTKLVVTEYDLTQQIKLHMILNENLKKEAKYENVMIIIRLNKNYIQQKYNSLTDLNTLKSFVETFLRKIEEILESEIYSARNKILAYAYKKIAEKYC